MRYPRDVGGTRKTLRPKYNRAGALESVELESKVYVERISYNAKGQRTLIAYGNGIMTRHAYNEETFRLMRMRTERYTKDGALTYRPKPSPTEQAREKNLLQDFAYDYDLASNIVALHDRTPESGVSPQPDRLDRAFTYDPLYRLLTATGRVCDNLPPPPPWDDRVRCSDPTKTRPYTETYEYDPAGNITRLKHTHFPANGNVLTGNRKFDLVPTSNRLAKMTVGTKPYAYNYDSSGNLTSESVARHFEWDHSDRLRVYRTQTGNSEPTLHAHYLYDAAGQRAKKLVRKKGQVEVTVYIDGVFEHHRIAKASASQENNTLHVMDDQSRVAQMRVGSAFSGDTTPAVKYHLGDHLGSSNVVIDAAGSWINHEEYTPYGETSFGSFARKRYRYTGKDRDEESGLYYYGARYYAPWLGRWVSCDPAGAVDGNNLYAAFRSNPITNTDPTGNETLDGGTTKSPDSLGLTSQVGKSTEVYNPHAYKFIENPAQREQYRQTKTVVPKGETKEGSGRTDAQKTLGHASKQQLEDFGTTRTSWTTDAQGARQRAADRGGGSKDLVRIDTDKAKGAGAKVLSNAQLKAQVEVGNQENIARGGKSDNSQVRNARKFYDALREVQVEGSTPKGMVEPMRWYEGRWWSSTHAPSGTALLGYAALAYQATQNTTAGTVVVDPFDPHYGNAASIETEYFVKSFAYSVGLSDQEPQKPPHLQMAPDGGPNLWLDILEPVLRAVHNVSPPSIMLPPALIPR
jgi:RHS repeat-associated protein